MCEASSILSQVNTGTSAELANGAALLVAQAAQQQMELSPEQVKGLR